MAFAEVDPGDVAAGLNPVGVLAGGVGAFRFALDCDGQIAGAVVAGDVGFVADKIGGQDRGVVQPGAGGKACDIKADADIGQVKQDQRRDREGGQAAGLEAALHGDIGCVGHLLAFYQAVAGVG